MKKNFGKGYKVVVGEEVGSGILAGEVSIQILKDGIDVTQKVLYPDGNNADLYFVGKETLPKYFAMVEDLAGADDGDYCARCGKPIKNVYEWNGEKLGKCCWKILALPEIEAKQMLLSEAWENHFRLEADAIGEMLEKKPLGRIKSQFKLDFIASLIQQINEKHFISKRQKEILFGTGAWNGSWYDNGMVGNKDWDNLIQAQKDRLLRD